MYQYVMYHFAVSIVSIYFSSFFVMLFIPLPTSAVLVYFLVEILRGFVHQATNDGYDHVEDSIDSGMGVYEDGTQEWIDPSAMRTDV